MGHWKARRVRDFTPQAHTASVSVAHITYLGCPRHCSKQWKHDGYHGESGRITAGQTIAPVKLPVDGWEACVEPRITWYGQAAVRIEAGGLRIAIDPFRLPADQPEADVLLISHDHSGHLSIEDIERVAGKHTAVFASLLATDQLDRMLNLRAMVPGDVVHHGALTIHAVPAYNVNKFEIAGVLMHPPESRSLGFVLEIDDLSFYFAGDTDLIPEMDLIGPVDYAFLPVGGATVMSAEEAAQAATLVQPSIAIPIHYGTSSGSLEDARRFGGLVPDQVRVWILNPTGDSSMLRP